MHAVVGTNGLANRMRRERLRQENQKDVDATKGNGKVEKGCLLIFTVQFLRTSEMCKWDALQARYGRWGGRGDLLSYLPGLPSFSYSPLILPFIVLHR